MSVIENLKFKIGNFTLDIPEIKLSDEGVTAITGISGSGKSTLFNLLLGIYEPQSGWSWKFKGEHLHQLSTSERRIGVVFQHHELFPHLTAEENITIVMKARNNYSPETRHKLDEYKRKLKLESCFHTLADNLSGGERQRVSLLRAIMSDPRLILLDEPFASLDANNKNESMELVKKVLSELKIPAYLITHSLEEAHFFTTRVIQIEGGKLLNSL